MKMLCAAVLTGLLLVAAGCSDDDKPKDSGLVDVSQLDMGADVEVPDTLAPDLPPADHNMGEGCKTNSDCKTGSPDCLVLSKAEGIGICSKTCTPDNPDTPLINEDDCPTDFVCASFNYTTATYNYCLKTCTPSMTTNPCPASSKQTCHPVSTRFTDLDQPVCWYLACKDGKDCPVMSATTCSIDADCTSVGADAFCESGECARPGKCNTTSGLCAPHTLGKAGSKVGDPCTSDFDCPNAGTCFPATSDSTTIGTLWANGYCTISGCAAASLTDFACPTGSACNHLYYGGICAKTCKLDDASTCRNNPADKGGDYECYAWDNLVVGGGIQVTSEPVCMSAASQECDMGASLSCATLGDQSDQANPNPTNMSCRNRFTGVATTQTDPAGVCLDNTASGPFAPAPDGGTTPDAMVPADGGTAPDVVLPGDAGTAD